MLHTYTDIILVAHSCRQQPQHGKEKDNPKITKNVNFKSYIARQLLPRQPNHIQIYCIPIVGSLKYSLIASIAARITTAIKNKWEKYHYFQNQDLSPKRHNEFEMIIN